MNKEFLNNLKENDVYSLILFSLYKLIAIPEYSSISELAYVLDKDNLLNLCEFFGGQTIKIPTLDELESLIYSLLLIKQSKIDRIPCDEAIKNIPKESYQIKEIKSTYYKLQEILNRYDFKPRDDY